MRTGGDSGKSEDVGRLLGGADMHLVNTDPPYNVKFEPRSNNAIVAGDPNRSRVYQKSRDVFTLPPLATPQVDVDALAVLREWITTLPVEKNLPGGKKPQ